MSLWDRVAVIHSLGPGGYTCTWGLGLDCQLPGFLSETAVSRYTVQFVVDSAQLDGFQLIHGSMHPSRNPFQSIYITPKKSPHKQTLPISLATTNPLSLSLDWPVLDVSHQ